jgi:hypothetical protein
MRPTFRTYVCGSAEPIDRTYVLTSTSRRERVTGIEPALSAWEPFHAAVTQAATCGAHRLERPGAPFRSPRRWPVCGPKARGSGHGDQASRTWLWRPRGYPREPPGKADDERRHGQHLPRAPLDTEQRLGLSGGRTVRSPTETACSRRLGSSASYSSTSNRWSPSSTALGGGSSCSGSGITTESYSRRLLTSRQGSRRHPRWAVV